MLQSDGLVGLAPTQGALDRSELFIDQLYEKGMINETVFTMYLGRNLTGNGNDQAKFWAGVKIGV